MQGNTSDNQKQAPSDTKDTVIRWFTAPRLAEYLAQQTGGRVEKTGKGKYRIADVHAGGLEIETKDDRAVWCIHAEGKGGDIFTAFERFESITDFAEQLRHGADIARIDISGNGHKAGSKAPPITVKTPCVAEYQYTDADGNPVKLKRRYEKPYSPDKTFRFYSADGLTMKEPEEWKNILYNLPDVIEAAAKGGVVWIVEGEKDADSMKMSGVTVTTAEYGAGPDKFSTDHVEHLCGAHCYIIADRDEAGRQYADSIATNLHGTAASIRVIETPQGKDASEFFELGGTMPDLVKIAEQSPEWIPEGERISTWAEAATLMGEITWAWQGWLPNGLLTMLVSESGKGKSALALRIAACFLRGDNWPDGTPYTGETGKVVWCESEGALSVNVDRARKAGVPTERMLSPLADPLEEFDLDNPEHVEKLRAMAARPEVQCIILDSLSGATQTKENDSTMLTPVKKCSSIATESGKPFLLLHHFNKGIAEGDSIHIRQIRGSSAIIQTARAVWAIDAPDDTDDTHRRLSMVKNNCAPFASPVGFRIAESGISFTNDAPRRRRTESAADKAKEFLLSALESGARKSTEVQNEAADAGISRRALFDARDQLGVVKTKKRDDEKWIWYLSLPAKQSPPGEE